jgi:UDPglucose--hexose-1-phosphate uridylyltransferase
MASDANNTPAAGPELRWHPFLRQWVGVAAHRQDRPQMPADWCPFCPGSGHVPADYDVLIYPNDFPAFSQDAADFSPEPGLYQSTGARGACDVVLYSPNHAMLPSQLPVEHWEKVIGLWTRRTAELKALPDVKYVAVFENTGVAIGVTMPHPHGQIYAFPFYPPLVNTIFESAREQADACLWCTVLRREIEAGVRIIAANDSFVAYVPFWGRFPTEVQILASRHLANLEDLGPVEKRDLAAMLSVVRRKYDNLYGFPMPLMMLVRQGPAGPAPWFHFHIDFLPIQRSPKKLKYLAAVESGTGTFLNDTRPEAQAEILRRTEPAA